MFFLFLGLHYAITLVHVHMHMQDGIDLAFLQLEEKAWDVALSVRTMDEWKKKILYWMLIMECYFMNIVHGVSSLWE